jgi:organic hydroperoxide reductase OsmC/OhrA
VTAPSGVHYFEAKLTWTGAPAAGSPDEDRAAGRADGTQFREFLGDVAGKPSLLLSAAPEYRGDASRHNPEDLLVLSLASCHALAYLSLCEKCRLEVKSYEDHPLGELKKHEGAMRFTKVTLRPRVGFARGADLVRAQKLHADARRFCFIANSVNFPIEHAPELFEEAP